MKKKDSLEGKISNTGKENQFRHAKQVPPWKHFPAFHSCTFFCYATGQSDSKGYSRVTVLQTVNGEGNIVAE